MTVAAPMRVLALCAVLVACSREAPETTHVLTVPHSHDSAAAGHWFELTVDREALQLAQLPEFIQLTSEAAVSQAEPWNVVRESPADVFRDFTPVWRSLPDGSLLLNWGGGDTCTTIRVSPQSEFRWTGTATFQWYDGTTTASAAELALKS